MTFLTPFSDSAGPSIASADVAVPRSQSSRRPATLLEWTNPVAYPDSWTLQRQFHSARLTESELDTLMLLEHQPVYTVGRRAAQTDLGMGEAALRRTGAIVCPVNRGGSVTYHGPGQLVGYPILKLAHYASGPREYVHLLEDVLISVLTSWDIPGCRMDNAPGVWVRVGGDDAKVASIGVRLDHGVTLHGFSLNVEMDLSPFSRIIPCGLAGCRTTSMAEIRGRSIPFRVVASQVATCFATVFNLAWRSHRRESHYPGLAGQQSPRAVREEVD